MGLVGCPAANFGELMDNSGFNARLLGGDCSCRALPFLKKISFICLFPYFIFIFRI